MLAKAESPIVVTLLLSPNSTLVNPEPSNAFASMVVKLVALDKSNVSKLAFKSVTIDSSKATLGSGFIYIFSANVDNPLSGTDPTIVFDSSVYA